MKDNEKNQNIKEKTEEKKLKLEPIIDVANELKASRKYHDDEDILINSNLNLKSMKKDLLFFKDDILKDLKREQTKLFEKIDDNEKYALEKIEEFNTKIQNYGEQIINLSNMIITDKTIREKVESLIEYIDKNQEIVTTHKIKIDNLDKDLFNNIYRIDNILKETVIYPGIIGTMSKFNSFHDFIDYVLKECTQNISFREQTSKEINYLKNNDEKIINNFTNKLDKTKKTLTLYIDTWIKKIENKINELNDTFNDRINTYRIENMTYLENMKKVSESLLKQVNNVIQAKNDIFNKFDEKMNIINKENTRMRKYFTGYKNEFNEMRKMFKEMLDAINTKDFVNINKKMKRLSRRQTMMNNDIKEFENKIINDNNNIVHPISMNDMFMNEGKIKSKFSIRKSFMPTEKEKNNPYKLFLQEYKRLDNENKRISKFFEKETLTEKKNIKEDLNLKSNEKNKKKHEKKIKYLNEIYLLPNTPNNIKFVKRRLNRFNSVCVPNNRISVNQLQKVPFEHIKIEKPNKNFISNKNNNKIKEEKKTKKINLNEETIYDTSISKSQNSLFSNSSKNSEEKTKNFKTKYKSNLTVKKVKDIDLSNFLKDKKNLDEYKIDLDEKDFQESEEYNQIINSNIPKNKNINGSKKGNNELEPNIFNYENKNTNMEQNKIKQNAKKKEKEKVSSDSLNKIYITVEGSNQLEIDTNSKKYNQQEKNVINNLKALMNNSKGKALMGYPKIVTNNGEGVIYSSRPIYKKHNFNSYTNPNVLALNYNIESLYEKNKKPWKVRKSNMEISPDNILQNTELLFKTRNSVTNNAGKSKKVSFSIFKSANFQK